MENFAHFGQQPAMHSDVDSYLQMAPNESTDYDARYPVEALPEDVDSTLKFSNEKQEPEYVEFNDDLYNKLKGQLLAMRAESPEMKNDKERSKSPIMNI